MLVRVRARTHTHTCTAVIFSLQLLPCGQFLWKTITKLFVSAKNNNILAFILTSWGQVLVIRPSTGHPYKEF
jgi:hypothetical protein